MSSSLRLMKNNMCLKKLKTFLFYNNTSKTTGLSILQLNGLSLQRKFMSDLKKSEFENHSTYFNDVENISIEESKDKSMFLCWHPEPEFPYEYSKPLPFKNAEMQEGDSVFKLQYTLDDLYKNHVNGPTDKELSEMFTVEKQEWRPKDHLRYRNPEYGNDRDREAI